MCTYVVFQFFWLIYYYLVFIISVIEVARIEYSMFPVHRYWYPPLSILLLRLLSGKNILNFNYNSPIHTDISMDLSLKVFIIYSSTAITSRKFSIGLPCSSKAYHQKTKLNRINIQIKSPMQAKLAVLAFPKLSESSSSSS